MLKQPGESIQSLLDRIAQKDRRALARGISMIENETPGYEILLQNIRVQNQTPIIGITGPPGAGKSTLISALVRHLIAAGKTLAVLAIDPSSPFNHGALMGDRVRMSEHFLHDAVFIRSMASRGSLGGLAPRIYEVAELIKTAGFDYILIETVGVGQSEVEIAGLADSTILVMVPEAGDEIQTIKSGIMEIADIFVVNKADREGADLFYNSLAKLAHQYAYKGWEAPVVKTVATHETGLKDLMTALHRHLDLANNTEKKNTLLAEKAMMLIREYRTRNISFEKLQAELKVQQQQNGFNLFRFVAEYNG